MPPILVSDGQDDNSELTVHGARPIMSTIQTDNTGQGQTMVQVAQLTPPQRHGSGRRARSGSAGGYSCVHLGPRRCPCPAWADGPGTPGEHRKSVEAMRAEGHEVVAG